MQDILVQNGLLDPAPDLPVFQEYAPLEWSENQVFLIKSAGYFENIKAGYRAVLSDTELKKAARFVKPEDYKSYVVRTYFLRKLLAAFFKTEPGTIQFHLSGNKKPGVDGIQFNVSHSAGLIAIALSKDPVGIDTELIKNDFSYDVMLDDSFSKSEQAMINRADNPCVGFYTLWTRKEALLKASAEGLNDQKLNQVDVLSAVCLRNGLTYQLRSMQVLENYMLSVAVSNPSKKIHYWRI